MKFRDLLERIPRIKRQVKHSQNELNDWLDDYITSGVKEFTKELSKEYSDSEVAYILSIVKAEDTRVNG